MGVIDRQSQTQPAELIVTLHARHRQTSSVLKDDYSAARTSLPKHCLFDQTHVVLNVTCS
jgi:hypothetical protein